MAIEAKKLGLAKSKDAIVLIYQDGNKMRQRLMPVRDLDRAGPLAAAHALIVSHKQLESVSFEQARAPLPSNPLTQRV